MREGQRLVEKTAGLAEDVEYAKLQTTRLLQAMYRQVCWTVEVVWLDAGEAVGGTPGQPNQSDPAPTRPAPAC